MKNYCFTHYRFCPVCGYRYSADDFNNENTAFNCGKCGYVFYQNQIAVASIIIPNTDDRHQILLTQRNLDPQKGKYDTPGGFPKYEEELTNTIMREVKEEIGLDIEVQKILTTKQNDYDFKGMTYKHAVTYFLAKPIKPSDLEKIKLNKKEISDTKFFDLREIDKFENELGFASDIKALKEYLKEIV